jgi:hypothetical protein
VAFSEKEEKGDRGKRGQIYEEKGDRGKRAEEKGDRFIYPGKRGPGKRGQIYLSVIFR